MKTTIQSILAIGVLTCCLLTQTASAQVVPLVNGDTESFRTNRLGAFQGAQDPPQLDLVSCWIDCGTPSCGGCDATSCDSLSGCDARGGCSSAGCKHDSCMTRTRLFGEMFGFRTCFAEHGITYSGSLTQFYQGVSSAGAKETSRYGGKTDSYFTADCEKLGLCKGGSLTMHTETGAPPGQARRKRS